MPQNNKITLSSLQSEIDSLKRLWVNASCPRGERGPKGDTGDRGEQGPKGDTGDRGEQGPKGDTGDRGPAGERGEKGDTGAKGDKGDGAQASAFPAAVTMVDNTSKVYVVPVDGKLIFNVETRTLEVCFGCKWYSVELKQ